jgi:quercetin dioxygenase-like cupin family protein
LKKHFLTLIVCLSLLLLNACTGNLKNINVETLVKSSVSWDGQALPDYPKGKPEITILRIKIPAGAKLEMHKHPAINAGLMLAGELTVITEKNETLYLKAGDSIIEVVDKWHYGKNEGNKTAEIIVFYAGIVNQPITVKATQGNK